MSDSTEDSSQPGISTSAGASTADETGRSNARKAGSDCGGIDVEGFPPDVTRRIPILQSSLVSVCGIGITLAAWAATAFHDLNLIRYAIYKADYGRAAEAAVFLGLITGLVYGSLVYLLARYMDHRRVVAHQCTSDADLDEFRGSGRAPGVTI